MVITDGESNASNVLKAPAGFMLSCTRDEPVAVSFSSPMPV